MTHRKTLTLELEFASGMGRRRTLMSG
jgi:hypothetical protein